MRPLTWDEYYEKFDTWSESTRVQYVSRLSNVGDHSQVADIANRLYNQGASDKLIRMACDAGIRFTAEDVYLIEFSVSPEVLQMAKDTIDARAARQKQKKANKEAFWTGAAETMFFDTLIDDLFHKKGC